MLHITINGSLAIFFVTSMDSLVTRPSSRQKQHWYQLRKNNNKKNNNNNNIRVLVDRSSHRALAVGRGNLARINDKRTRRSSDNA